MAHRLIIEVVGTALVGEQLIVQVHPLRAQRPQNELHLLGYHLQEVVDGVHTLLTYEYPLNWREMREKKSQCGFDQIRRCKKKDTDYWTTGVTTGSYSIADVPSPLGIKFGICEF